MGKFRGERPGVNVPIPTVECGRDVISQATSIDLLHFHLHTIRHGLNECDSLSQLILTIIITIAKRKDVQIIER